jgi:hypothetical protein
VAAPPQGAGTPPSNTSHLFSARKPAERNSITHERLAADLEAFRKAGGKIEVLGVTRALKKIDGEAGDPPHPAPAKPRR